MQDDRTQLNSNIWSAMHNDDYDYFVNERIFKFQFEIRITDAFCARQNRNGNKWSETSGANKIAESNCILFCWWSRHWTLKFHRTAILIRMHWPISWMWLCHSFSMNYSVHRVSLFYSADCQEQWALCLRQRTRWTKLILCICYIYIYVYISPAVFQLYYCENMKFFCLIRDAQFFLLCICSAIFSVVVVSSFVL